MLVMSKSKFVRMSPKKVRLIVEAIRGKNAATAERDLGLMNKAAVQPVLKTLKAAIADAENTYELDKTKLTVKTAVANEGPRLKRFQPRARGAAHSILKRTAHVVIVLESPEEGKKKKLYEIPTVSAAEAALQKEAEVTEEQPAKEKPAAKEPAPAAEEKKAAPNIEEELKKEERKAPEPPAKTLLEEHKKSLADRSRSFAKRFFRRKTG